MPGLFGLVAIDDPSGIDRGFAETLFSKIEERLSHSTQQVERWHDGPAGIYVGRVGVPHFNSVPWGGSVEAAGRKAFTFFSGTLHANGCQGSPGSTVEARRFLDSGFSGIKQLRGFYSAVLHSREPSLTVVAADCRASIPLYYAEWGGMLIFAPEVKAILSLHNISRDLDLEAVATFLGSGHVMAHQSLLKSIRRLQGGEALVITRGRVERRAYWKFQPGSRLNGASDEELEEELGHLVEAAVRRNLGDPEKTVIFLSGGADSRGILAGAMDAVDGCGELLSTVCWGAHRGSNDSDAGIAEKIAGTYNLNHRFVRRKIDNYVQDFRSTNYLLDGQSDMAALHPYEHHLMLDLCDAGFSRALRGDQIFGWRPNNIHTHAHALTEACLRRISDLALVADYVNPTIYRTLTDASNQAMDSILDSVQHLEPNDAKDYLFYSHRIQGYMNSGAYLKQVVLDTRNVLLDEDILGFLEQVPASLRVDKLLYRRAMRRKYRELWAIPMAKEHTLEDWKWQLGNETALRRFVSEQLEDTHSGIWQYFDRGALRALLDSLRDYTPPRKESAYLSGMAFAKKAVLSAAPKFASAVIVGNEARYHPTDRALLRVMALKDWYDTQAS